MTQVSVPFHISCEWVGQRNDILRLGRGKFKLHK